MSLWKIAWRSVQKRGVASMLTTLSMALGVMLVVCVLSIYGVVSEQFKNSSNLGYNMLVGATKGGRLQLTLNSVYYLSEPVENISYPYYLEFFDQATRDRQLKNSFAYEAHQATWDTLALHDQLMLDPLGGALLAESLGEASFQASIERTDLQLGRDGKFKPFTAFAIPVNLGDYFGRFRVVGTTPDFFEKLKVDPVSEQPYAFAEGRNFEEWNAENQYFEAVVGAKVAREMNVQLGDVINPAHGDPEGHGHAQGFTVVGILAPSGKPIDRAAFINIEGFYLMADHAKPIEIPDEQKELYRTGDSAPQPAPGEPLPLEQREVTSVLVSTVSPFVVPGMQNLINEGKEAQAVLPVKEIFDLMDLIVQPVQQLLLAMTALICLVSGVSILVSIYNSMSDRRHEIAVMRALGASRNVVMAIILLEAVFLALGGGALGWVLGHSLNAALAPTIEERTGVQLTFFSLAPPVNVFEPLGIDPRRYGLKIPVLSLLGWVLGGVLTLFAGVVLAYRAFRTSPGWGLAVLLAHPLAAPVFGFRSARGVLFWWICGVCLILLATVGFATGMGDAISSELMLIPALMLLAILVGFVPAIAGYRTDVAQSLGK